MSHTCAFGATACVDASRSSGASAVWAVGLTDTSSGGASEDPSSFATVPSAGGSRSTLQPSLRVSEMRRSEKGTPKRPDAAGWTARWWVLAPQASGLSTRTRRPMWLRCRWREQRRAQRRHPAVTGFGRCTAAAVLSAARMARVREPAAAGSHEVPWRGTLCQATGRSPPV